MNSLAPGSSARPANRLGREKSPYLLQHQFNPVDWHAWHEEAFAQARRENKPIFLSVGYSTCHWCHVMERESFEDPAVGSFLNQHFVSIKVDREERPDVDKIYMTFVQATTGQGGWPLSVFLTPDLKPFFGGTYFPPEDRHGRPGFLALLRQVQEVWQGRREDVLKSASRLHVQLRHWTAQNTRGEGDVFNPALLQRAAARLQESYDPLHGGFGGAPKFPQPGHPQLLLRHALRCRDVEASTTVIHTCDAMAAGGIHDQLGGGFARYSVDEAWRVPHFEKMLYDNAQLAQLYQDAFLFTGAARHAAVARGILDYVLRDMTSPAGGFYSAEDADSEGHEGKFYCWTRVELAELLTPDEFRAATRYFGVTAEGNFVDHSHPQPLSGQNVLYVAESSLSELELSTLTSARTRMLEARSRRVRPHRDDKVLASWNGLMLGAMARAGVVLGEERYRLAAVANAQFIRTRLWDEASRSLYHRWRDGERDSVQLLEGYAAMLDGLVTLYETTLEPAGLEWCLALAESMITRFHDPEQGGFWQSGVEASDLILRVKEDYDGAEPSGNSLATLALLRLGKITGRADFTEAAERTLRLFGGRIEQAPHAVPCLLHALDFALQEPFRVVIAGDSTHPATRDLIAAAHGCYQPNRVILGTLGPVEPFAATLPKGNSPCVYLCTGTECRPPTSDPAEVKRWLEPEGLGG